MDSDGYFIINLRKVDLGREPLFAMLISPDPKQRAKGIRLVKKGHAGIVRLADDLFVNLQLEPIAGVLSGNRCEVVDGVKRCLARAYNYARSDCELPLNVKVAFPLHQMKLITEEMFAFVRCCMVA